MDIVERESWRVMEDDSKEEKSGSKLCKPPQPFYGPFSGTARVSWCQKRSSGLYGAMED